MSEHTETTPPAPAAEAAPEGSETPEEPEFALREIVADDLDGISFEDAISGTIIEFDDGDIVKGTIVKVDKDEVLLDIGYKSEGVIPARELSIRHDVDPGEYSCSALFQLFQTINGFEGIDC